MKTSIQELQEWMTENHFKVTFAFLDQLEYCKQKEKEQIIDAYRIASINNASNEDMKNIKAEYWQINAELWYDKHYNQNK
jgi:hypothetical protein